LETVTGARTQRDRSEQADRSSGEGEPIVDAVVLSYNSAETLASTLEHVRAQSVPVRSILVVDNASSDDTPRLLELVGVGSLLLPENRGVGAGHNAGWRHVFDARGDTRFIWSLEHDSEPSAGCLERLLTTWEAVQASGVPVGAVVPRQLSTQADPGRSDLEPYVAPRMTFNAALILVEAMRAVGYLREDFFVGHEDREYAWRLTRGGYAIVHDPVATVVHRNKGARRRYESRSVVRDYYSARNELFLRRHVRNEPWATTRMAARSTLHIARVVLRSDQRSARVRARLVALRDGTKGDLGEKRYAFLRGRG
jgi:GT2 family glycosyltransferase